jgi:hypothetical protein
MQLYSLLAIGSIFIGRTVTKMLSGFFGSGAQSLRSVNGAKLSLVTVTLISGGTSGTRVFIPIAGRLTHSFWESAEGHFPCITSSALSRVVSSFFILFLQCHATPVASRAGSRGKGAREVGVPSKTLDAADGSPTWTARRSSACVPIRHFLVDLDQGSLLRILRGI